MSLTNKQIKEVALLTSDAYSFNRYGIKKWMKAIEYLDSEGFSLSQIDYVLRSKLMRWAADSCCEINSRGGEKLNGLEIKKYFEKYPNEKNSIDLNEVNIKLYEALEQRWELENSLIKKRIKKI